MLPHDEVAQHNNAESLWVIVKVCQRFVLSSLHAVTRADLMCQQQGEAYDLTEFAPNHPGGMGILLKYAGKEATQV